MGKLVITILAFTLGALMMLESVGASNDCRSYNTKGYVYIIRMDSKTLKADEGGQWYKIGGTIDFKKRLPTLQTGNPYKLEQIKQYKVSDCKRAEQNVKRKLDSKSKFVKGSGGTEWYKVKPSDLTSFVTEVEKVTKNFIESLANAEGDNDDMIDSGHPRFHLQKLLMRLLD
jgi:hypothetical protein